MASIKYSSLEEKANFGFIAIDSGEGVIWGVGASRDELAVDVRVWLAEASEYEDGVEDTPFFVWLEEMHRVKVYSATLGAVAAVRAQGADAAIERHEHPDYVWIKTEEEPDDEQPRV